MASTGWKKAFRRALVCVAAMIILIAAIPMLLYIPAVQNLVKDIAVKEVKKSTGIDITIDYLRVKFPLKVQLDGVTVVDSAAVDTMVRARSVGLDVAFMPLLRGEIDVTGLSAEGVRYQYGTVDSTLYLVAEVDFARLDAASIALKRSRIEADHASIDGARVTLVMQPDTVYTPPDTTQSTPWFIHAREVEMSRVSYMMQMLPTIDTLRAYVGSGRLLEGTVDIGRRCIHGQYLEVDSVDATYLYPSPQFAASNPEFMARVARAEEVSAMTPVDTTEGMWVITADSLRLTARRGLYAMSGARPVNGLDMDYLQVSDVVIAVDSFYNCGVAVRVPLRQLSGRERCGLTLDAHGLFDMDSTSMRLEQMTLLTNRSQLYVERALLGMGDFTTDPSVPIALDASMRLNPADVALAFPSLGAMLGKARSASPITAVADLHGTSSRLTVAELQLNAGSALTLSGNGTIDYPFDPDRLGGKVGLKGRLTDGSLIASLLPPGTLPEILHIPAMGLEGTVDYHPGSVSGNLRATAGNGSVALDGSWTARTEGYDARLDVNAFPVDAFMPTLGVGTVTGRLEVHGHGYNPLKASTVADIDLHLAHVAYQGQELSDISLTATAGGGRATGRLYSANPAADLEVDFDACARGADYEWQMDGTVHHLDLEALHLMEMPCSGTLTLTSTGCYNTSSGDIDGRLAIGQMVWTYDAATFSTDAATLELATTASTVNASVDNGDMSLRLASLCSMEQMMARFETLPAVFDTIIARRCVDVEELQRAVPRMELTLNMGDDNLAASYLRQTLDFDAAHVALDLRNDSVLNLQASLCDMVYGTTRIDSLSLDALQHGTSLAYAARMANRPGTWDDFASVSLNGFVSDNHLSAFLSQHNIQGEQGFNIGLVAQLSDSVATARLVPTTPVIGYRRWNLNEDNYISYNLYTRQLLGDLSLSDDKSSLRVYTEGGDTPADPTDLVVDIKDINLADWVTLSPTIQPMKGQLSAHAKVRYDNSILVGTGAATLSDFYYNRKRVGTFDLDFDISTDPVGGAVTADIGMMVDSVKTLNIHGVLNDSTATSPLQLDLSLIHFPLEVVNPFIPDNMASLKGTLNGSLNITGTQEKPLFDGYLQLDSTEVKVTMLGTPLKVSPERIPVDKGVVIFDDFTITAANENPLYINGRADINDLANIGLNLNLFAHDMMVVNSSRPRGADVYGHGYIDLNASVRGNMRFMMVKADLTLLEGSNVTYVMGNTMTSDLSSLTGTEMVHFVNLNDTAGMAEADSIAERPTALILTAGIHVDDGTTINVDLSTDGKNKVQLCGQGNLTYTMSPVNDGRLTGRYTIESGFVRYTPPMLAEKFFRFTEGSYVAFTGNMMNPTLSLYAVDEVKANVTRSGENSRLVNFNVEVAVTQTLENMKIAFDLSTNDDITVSNELASMSADQRANQAMNLLLYGVYSDGGTTGNANIGGNLLYSFLESQINSWMANNIHGVDISFGINQYDKTYNGYTSTATNYSYHVSKTLFNDRFKIVVGGTYSTDPENDESVAESLINDISAEWMLNNAGTMYVKLFRHTGYESILEGEVTQTGVGFVYRKRLNSLWDIFRRTRSQVPTVVLPADSVPTDSINHPIHANDSIQ